MLEKGKASHFLSVGIEVEENVGNGRKEGGEKGENLTVENTSFVCDFYNIDPLNR